MQIEMAQVLRLHQMCAEIPKFAYSAAHRPYFNDNDTGERDNNCYYYDPHLLLFYN